MAAAQETGNNYQEFRVLPFAPNPLEKPLSPSGAIFEPERPNDGFSKEAYIEANRIRLTDEFFAERPNAYSSITIDGENTKDRDDAWGLEKTEYGSLLHVSIAAPASVIDIDSFIFEDAKERSFTEYLSWGNKPMIPRVLSENLLSLHEGERKPTITISTPIVTTNGVAIGIPEISETQLTSQKQLTYSEADSLIQNGSDKYGDLLKDSLGLAIKLFERRSKRGGIKPVFDLRKEIGTSEEGVLREMPPEEAFLADMIIREFMILTNESVGNFMKQNNIPTLFRNHKNLTRRASYGISATGHAGLGLDAEHPYTHFTSPLRRMADFVVQGQMVAALKGKPLPYSTADLQNIARTINSRESVIRARREEYFKKINQTATEAMLKGNFANLESKEFSRVLKLAAKTDKMSLSLKTEILERTENGLLTNHDLFNLFSHLPYSGFIENLLSRAEVRPGAFKDILTMARHAQGWSSVSYEPAKKGPNHFVIARINLGEETYSSDTMEAEFESHAKHLAGLNLLRKMVETSALLGNI